MKTCAGERSRLTGGRQMRDKISKSFNKYVLLLWEPICLGFYVLFFLLGCFITKSAVSVLSLFCQRERSRKCLCSRSIQLLLWHDKEITNTGMRSLNSYLHIFSWWLAVWWTLVIDTSFIKYSTEAGCNLYFGVGMAPHCVQYCGVSFATLDRLSWVGHAMLKLRRAISRSRGRGFCSEYFSCCRFWVMTSQYISPYQHYMVVDKSMSRFFVLCSLL